jgi:hypothetical protein
MTQDLILTLAGGALTFIVWLVRLEARIKQSERDIAENQKDVDILRARHEDLDSRVLKELMEVKQALARIEGRLEIKKGEK